MAVLNHSNHLSSNSFVKFPKKKILDTERKRKSFIGVGFMLGQEVEILWHRSKQHFTRKERTRANNRHRPPLPDITWCLLNS